MAWAWGIWAGRSSPDSRSGFEPGQGAAQAGGSGKAQESRRITEHGAGGFAATQGQAGLGDESLVRGTAIIIGDGGFATGGVAGHARQELGIQSNGSGPRLHTEAAGSEVARMPDAKHRRAHLPCQGIAFLGDLFCGGRAQVGQGGKQEAFGTQVAPLITQGWCPFAAGYGQTLQGGGETRRFACRDRMTDGEGEAVFDAWGAGEVESLGDEVGGVLADGGFDLGDGPGEMGAFTEVSLGIDGIGMASSGKAAIRLAEMVDAPTQATCSGDVQTVVFQDLGAEQPGAGGIGLVDEALFAERLPPRRIHAAAVHPAAELVTGGTLQPGQGAAFDDLAHGEGLVAVREPQGEKAQSFRAQAARSGTEAAFQGVGDTDELGFQGFELQSGFECGARWPGGLEPLPDAVAIADQGLGIGRPGFGETEQDPSQTRTSIAVAQRQPGHGTDETTGGCGDADEREAAGIGAAGEDLLQVMRQDRVSEAFAGDRDIGLGDEGADLSVGDQFSGEHRAPVVAGLTTDDEERETRFLGFAKGFGIPGPPRQARVGEDAPERIHAHTQAAAPRAARSRSTPRSAQRTK